MKGRGAVFEEAGKPFVIQELPTPEVEAGGALIRVTASSICGSDLHYWRGDNPPPIRVGEPGPMIPGHEMMGTVHTLGKEVTTDSLRKPLKEGDRVAYAYFVPCMKCYNCMRGELSSCPYRDTRQSIKSYPYCSGGFAEYFYLRPGHFIFKVPDELSDEAVAPVNCALSVVTEGLTRSGVRLEDMVVVQGAGGLGLNAAAVAKEMGAGLVISIDGHAGRLEMARQCGADETININDLPDPQERVAHVKGLTEGRGADIVVEVVGKPYVVPEGLEMLRTGGTYVEIGHITPKNMVSLDFARIVGKQVRLLGVAHYNPAIIPMAMDFLVRTKDRYALTRMVSHNFPLEQINEAFEAAEWMGREGGSQVTRAIITS